MSKSFRIITLGCKVNQYESAYLDESLTLIGWQRAVGGEKTDISIINTCIVTQAASHQSRQAIRKAIRENPKGIVVVTGCYAQVFPDELSGIDGICIIAGNVEKGNLPKLISDTTELGKIKLVSSAFKPGAPFDFLPIKRFSGRTRAFLKIQDGCQSFCSYCIVPLARGFYRSLSATKVLSMVESLAKEGYNEIVLTGIHLGKYGADLEKGVNLNQLLVSIGKEGLPVRIRLSSLEISEIDIQLVEMMASESWLCRHFHIPLQSGDDRIIKKMKRNYIASHFEDLIGTIHSKVPHAAIGVDIMSGFPGEDPVAHQNTCSLINDLPVSYLHVFPYSPRPGTAASTYDAQVDPKVTKIRAAELRYIGQKKRTAFYQRCLGKEFMVLPERWHSEQEGIMKGISDNYIPVLFPLDQESNKPIPVYVERVKKNMMIGFPSSVCKSN